MEYLGPSALWSVVDLHWIPPDSRNIHRGRGVGENTRVLVVNLHLGEDHQGVQYVKMATAVQAVGKLTRWR